MKKLPPYGKPLDTLIKAGSRPRNSINLFIGNKAWQKGQAFSVSYPTRTLILSPWESPLIYQWPVRQCEILIFDTGFAEVSYIHDLVKCLYQDGAARVLFVSPDFKLTNFHRESDHEFT